MRMRLLGRQRGQASTAQHAQHMPQVAHKGGSQGGTCARLLCNSKAVVSKTTWRCGVAGAVCALHERERQHACVHAEGMIAIPIYPKAHSASPQLRPARRPAALVAARRAGAGGSTQGEWAVRRPRAARGARRSGKIAWVCSVGVGGSELSPGSVKPSYRL